jgi:transcription antitermination factor NusG
MLMMADDTRYRLLFEKEMQRRALQAHRRKIIPGMLPRVRVPFWGLARTPHGRERFAKLNIEKGGNRTFVPRVHDANRGAKLFPLFPGYVFVLIEEERWLHLQFTPGVIGVVKNMGRIARVQEFAIEQLLREQGEDGYIELAPVRWHPDTDDTIKIKEGVFKDHLARYIGLDPENRIRAVLDFMGKEVELKLSRKQIGPASD